MQGHPAYMKKKKDDWKETIACSCGHYEVVYKVGYLDDGRTVCMDCFGSKIK